VIPPRVNLIIAASQWDADLIRDGWPQFAKHLALTPQSESFNVVVREYVWTPDAKKLSPSTRLRLRGVLAPLLDDNSIEEIFPSTLLSW
jgi:hypothetical protein